MICLYLIVVVDVEIDRLMLIYIHQGGTFKPCSTSHYKKKTQTTLLKGSTPQDNPIQPVFFQIFSCLWHDEGRTQPVALSIPIAAASIGVLIWTGLMKTTCVVHFNVFPVNISFESTKNAFEWSPETLYCIHFTAWNKCSCLSPLVPLWLFRSSKIMKDLQVVRVWISISCGQTRSTALTSCA